MLSIKDLFVEVEGMEILKGINLVVKPGVVHLKAVPCRGLPAVDGCLHEVKGCPAVTAIEQHV